MCLCVCVCVCVFACVYCVCVCLFVCVYVCCVNSCSVSIVIIMFLFKVDFAVETCNYLCTS